MTRKRRIIRMVLGLILVLFTLSLNVWFAERIIVAMLSGISFGTILSKNAWFHLDILYFLGAALFMVIVVTSYGKMVFSNNQRRSSRWIKAIHVLTRVAQFVFLANVVLVLVVYFKANSKSTLTFETIKEQFPIVIKSLNKGFLQTLKLFGVTLLGALPLGLVVAFGSMSQNKLIARLVHLFVWIIRGTPLMLQLLIIFYFPGLVFGKQLWGNGENARFLASAVAFIINYSCYFSEIYRGGIQGVPVGQQEAGQVLGLSGTQIFFRITLLQMIKRIVPPMSNEIITLVKDTSLARIIALQEVIWAGQAFMKGSEGISGAIWPLFFTGVYYLVFSGILTLLFGWVEKKLSYFKA